MVLVDVLQPVALKFVQLLETTDQKPRAAAISTFAAAQWRASRAHSRYLQKLNEISV
jgi:hypothetical protein